ncbi:type VI secretion system protein TssA [Massilia sp. Root351]|uniref:type VI secretion system protein TssA n=1 Tax=Massilia sp. Root351 TaxID=1736522 RepID=UPI0019110A28|nr:type VI secretion system protein TssA [Massilia sp. Root351]
MDIDSLLVDVEADAPCGPNLEYDPEFLELEQAILGKPEVQYGDTITPAVPPEWKVVKRLAAGLLERSRDLRLAVSLARALLALEGMPGLANGLALIERLLEQRWDSVHPQLDPDDGMDPMLRINSLATLADNAFLREVKEATLLMLPGLGPLSLRTLEVANGELQPAEGESKVELHSIAAALQDADPERVAASSAGLAAACDSVTQIEVTLVRQVGSSQALNLDALVRLLRRGRDFFAGQGGGERAGGAAAEGEAEGEDADAVSGGAAAGKGGTRAAAISGDVTSRADVIRMLDKINKYYQQYEPSSPVPLLLERAKRLVPKNFFEIMEDLAPDGMTQLLVVSGPREEESQQSEY